MNCEWNFHTIIFQYKTFIAKLLALIIKFRTYYFTISNIFSDTIFVIKNQTLINTIYLTSTSDHFTLKTPAEETELFAMILISIPIIIDIAVINKAFIVVVFYPTISEHVPSWTLYRVRFSISLVHNGTPCSERSRQEAQRLVRLFLLPVSRAGTIGSRWFSRRNGATKAFERRDRARGQI